MNTWLGSALLLFAASMNVSCGRTQHEIDAPKAMKGSPVPVATPSVPAFLQTPIAAVATPTPSPTASVSPSPVIVASTPAIEAAAVTAPAQPIYPQPAVAAAPAQPIYSQPAAAPDHNLFVVISGNGTCNPRLDSRVIPGLWSTDTFDYFVGNVLNRGMVRPQDDVLFICYERLSPEMNFFYLRSSRSMQSIHEAQVDSLVLSHAQGVRQLIMVGYSYGGWRAMKLASSPLILAAMQTPTLLVTIDPISKIYCAGAFDSGCHDAPQDFSGQELQILSTRTRWINLYETRGLLVSSGCMPNASQNYEIDAVHLNITKRGEVWGTIVQFLQMNLPRGIQ